MPWYAMLFGLKGRMRRRDFWIYGAISVVLGFVLIVASLILPQYMFPHVNNPDPVVPTKEAALGMAIMSSLTLILLSAIWSALLTKRLHDRGKSMWWLGLVVVPVLGQLFLFVDCGLSDGDSGPNRYGPSPKGLIIPEAVF